MCRLLGAVLCSLAFVLAAPWAPAHVFAAAPASRSAPVCPAGVSVCLPATSQTSPRHSPHPPRHQTPPLVSLSIATGYSEQYRSSAWVPVRVTVHNRTATLQTGTVVVPDRGGGDQWSIPAYAVLYQAPLVVPAGATKQVTLYLSGQDIGNVVIAQFRQGGRIVAAASDAPSGLDDQTISVGTLAGDLQATFWLNQVNPRDSNVDVINLSPATLDPVAAALATFDTIVLSNYDTSHLDADQLAALQRYVQNGGSLVLVGGPNWQETLRPLPASLLPGRLTGSRLVPALSGLRLLGGSAPPHHQTLVSVLTHPRGSVVAWQGTTPLMVRRALGKGRIVYLAFDPAFGALSGWPAASRLLTDLIMQAAPQVASRLSIANAPSLLVPSDVGPASMRQELDNLPGASGSSLVLLVGLGLLSILLIGPLNFLVVHLLGRRELLAITIPMLAALCFGATLAVAGRARGSLTLLNTVSMIELNGPGPTHPASMYVGLFAPLRGDYRVVWKAPALAQSLPPYIWAAGTSPGSTPVGLDIQEGAETVVDFRSMDMWSTRSVSLQTSVSLPGTLRSNLHLAPDGAIVGTVRNTTSLTLLRPMIIAGSAVARLPDLRPGATLRVRVVPALRTGWQAHSTLWDQVYQPSRLSAALGTWDGDPWEAPSPLAEKTLTDRLRNVSALLPQAQTITSLGEILFLGWSERTLGTVSVNGAAPQRRDLSLVAATLAVHFPRGPFHLRRGTIGAYLVDAQPQQPQFGCCFDSTASQPVALGPGGSATFEFDMPRTRALHFSRLQLWLDTGGAVGPEIGQAFDWQTGRWVYLDLETSLVTLPHPDRFISPSGALLVRLRANNASGDITISDPRQDLQISGWATG